jgi:hypothetical protein
LAMISCDGTELEHRQITQSALKLVASSWTNGRKHFDHGACRVCSVYYIIIIMHKHFITCCLNQFSQAKIHSKSESLSS